MSTLFWKTVKASPVLLVASLFVASGASAAESNSHQTAADLSTAAINLDAEPTASISPTLDDAALTEAIPATDTPKPTVTVSPTFQLADSTFPEPVPAAGDSSVNSNQEILQQIQRYGNEGSASLDQVTSVGQLRDVSPGDWAYEALRSLVERYGCIAGYPDGTYRGNRALTRYEFAAGLNACLQQIERLIGDGGEIPDLETLRRLIQEFEAELATLGARVDNLEGRVAFLEDNQFSTTTKLRGEVIFGLADTFGDTIATGDDDTNTVLGDRVRLNFETSFTGRDRLRTRLEAINMAEFDSGVTGTNMTRLGFDGADGNDVAVDELWYRFPFGDNLLVQIDAANGEFQDTIIDVVNPFFDSSGSGSISRFGRFNPIYRTGGGAGGTLTYSLGDALELSASYFADEGSDPGEDRGLFNGNFAALGQITFKPTENISIAGTYVRSYYRGEDLNDADGNVNVTGSTGSLLARRPFTNNVATSADSFGLQANATFGKFSVGGWVGYQDVQAEDDFGFNPLFPMLGSESLVKEGDDAEIWNWAVNLALLDLGGEGNKLGVVFGQPPKVTDNDAENLVVDADGNQILSGRDDDDTSYHLEVFYRYQLTDNIAITPGAFVIFNPEHEDDNDDIWVGTIRTVFSF
ncbi:iron uptake porin [Coleofasciculus sp. B1-GNL1-01]|uniref:iron uptake porin n=1 Tax=Coleofasciculus sp. B1-GNL1-01 TaxID=3068484 RepID=UPI004063AA45